MYPITFLLVLQRRGTVLPDEVVEYIIRISWPPCLVIKDELLKDREFGWLKGVGADGVTVNHGMGRIDSLERAIQIAVLDMGLPCCPMRWYTQKDDPDALIPVEEAIAEPHIIRESKACSMTPEQRCSQVAYDLKLLTIEYMRELVKTSQPIYMGNLINFDGTWIKCKRTPPRGFKGWSSQWQCQRAGWSGGIYQVSGFRVVLDKTERENMYPSLYGPVPMQCRVKTRW